MLVKKIKIKEEPGPGAYDTTDKHRNKEPSYSIGKGLREDNLKSVKKDDYPGPGTYGTKELNISRGAYAKYETGINTPPTNVIISLSIFFGVTTDYIMGRYKDEEYK